MSKNIPPLLVRLHNELQYLFTPTPVQLLFGSTDILWRDGVVQVSACTTSEVQCDSVVAKDFVQSHICIIKKIIKIIL